MELSVIVKAEEKAEDLVRKAEEKKASAIAAALREREERLANVRAPAKRTISLATPPPDLEALRASAGRNKARAVQRILEEFYAAT